mmetsp:Transcript_128440/g.250151  ORF Transcript_128440/g.250151 Transcript_128440/m.250151 type:complete len:91 (-) Transcript_128440:394-666(-)
MPARAKGTLTPERVMATNTNVIVHVKANSHGNKIVQKIQSDCAWAKPSLIQPRANETICHTTSVNWSDPVRICQADSSAIRRKEKPAADK